MKYKEGDLILCVHDRDYGIVLSVNGTLSQAGNARNYYKIHWAQDGIQENAAGAIDRDSWMFTLVARSEI